MILSVFLTNINFNENKVSKISVGFQGSLSLLVIWVRGFEKVSFSIECAVDKHCPFSCWYINFIVKHFAYCLKSF